MKKNNLSQAGEGSAEGIIGLIIFALIGVGVLWLFGLNFGAVNEGEGKYDDCRSIVRLQPGSWQTYFGKFTCTYIKTKKGAIMSGECVKIENDSSLLSSSHTCATAYIYEVPQDNLCTDTTHPYLTYDDMCSTTKQY